MFCYLSPGSQGRPPCAEIEVSICSHGPTWPAARTTSGHLLEARGALAPAGFLNLEAGQVTMRPLQVPQFQNSSTGPSPQPQGCEEAFGPTATEPRWSKTKSFPFQPSPPTVFP